MHTKQLFQDILARQCERGFQRAQYPVCLLGEFDMSKTVQSQNESFLAGDAIGSFTNMPTRGL